MRRLGITLIGLVMLATPALGQEGSDQLRALGRRVAHDRVRAKYLRTEESSILRGLRKIEDDLYRARREAKKLEVTRDAIELRRAELTQRAAEAVERLDGLRSKAGRRAAGMLRLRRTSLPVLLASARAEGRIQARRLRDRYRYALAYDVGLLRSARAASTQLDEASAGLAKEQAALEKTQAELREHIDTAELLEAERQALLEAVREERRSAERLVRELSAARRQLEGELKKVRGTGAGPELAAGGFAAQKGRLPWPAEGRVEVGFGKKVDPRSEVVLVSQGIDLRAGQSEPVRAVFDGRVVFAGILDGYGRTLIVAHGDGFHSLYAHLERMEVEQGSPVKPFQVIGLVGDSGSFKGAYLHFQLRHRGQPVDPMKWLAP